MQKLVRQHYNPATNLRVNPQTLFIKCLEGAFVLS
jgi:hypothetical protein